MADEKYHNPVRSAGVTDSEESTPEEAAGAVASSAHDAEADKQEDTDKQEAEAAEEAQEEAHEPTPEELVAQAKAEAAESLDRYMRLQAEWDNFRKRSAAEREQERARATERLVSNLLPVIDDIERAIAHAQANPDVSAASITEGVSAVHAKLLDVLKKEKTVPIDPKDEAFDANRHAAVHKVDDENIPDETVVAVYQKGYEMAGKVIRPAMVAVSSGGPVREKPSDEDDEAAE